MLTFLQQIPFQNSWLPKQKKKIDLNQFLVQCAIETHAYIV